MPINAIFMVIKPGMGTLMRAIEVCGAELAYLDLSLRQDCKAQFVFEMQRQR